VKRFLIVFISILLLATTTRAEEKVSVGEIVVTASKIEEAVSETTSEVVVITKEEIENSGAKFIPDVLRLVSEVMVRQTGGVGHDASVLLRGGSSSNTLVLIDGVKVNSTTTGGYDFSGISVEDIERIEIVKGPQSTIYGSEAMAGVINIITKRGKGKAKIDASLEGGSHGTYNPSLGISGGTDTYDYRITTAYYRTEGISAARNGTEDDGYRQALVSGKFGLRGKRSELELSGRYSYDRSELDSWKFDPLTMTFAFMDDLNYVQRRNNYLIMGKGKLYLTDNWEQSLTLSRSWEHLKGSDTDDIWNRYDITTKIDTADWQHNVFATESYTATLGLEYRKEEGENKGQFDKSVDNKALYLNNKLKLGKAVMTAGLRHDDHETFGEKTTYRVGAVYQTSPSVSLKASYGTGFRAPSLNELFYPFYGDPNLKPEESKSWEVGIEQKVYEGGSLTITYFKQDYENLIQTDPLTFTAKNIAEAEIKGVEVSAEAKEKSGSGIRAGYTYLDTEDKSTGKRLPYRAKNKVTASLFLVEGGSTLTLEYNYVGGRFDNLASRDLKPYNLVNLGLTMGLSKSFSLYARVDNLFNKEYEEAANYGTYKRSYYAGLKASF